ncbi:hypothetical protein V6N11_009209 [Hibiscus sabdariffa]|uniref:Association with the SNF1 complex (ASC) domain-containing protein n=1 Tax=Hibiscus sabdariffa TaxID=183260 RepID=A0ABR2PQJ7_9ROSI
MKEEALSRNNRLPALAVDFVFSATLEEEKTKALKIWEMQTGEKTEPTGISLEDSTPACQSFLEPPLLLQLFACRHLIRWRILRRRARAGPDPLFCSLLSGILTDSLVALVHFQVPIAPLPSMDGHSFSSQIWRHDSPGVADSPSEKGIPVIITWNYGGNNVAVEGSWDNWKSRKTLRRSGKDHSILVVLPSGIYHYKFIVDGEWRYAPDLPFSADEMGHICNLLDVHDYVPENLASVTEFEAPGSPNSSYGQAFPMEEDFAKEPAVVPSQLHLTVLGPDNQDIASSSKPQHVVLNHLFIEKGWASQSVVALGLTHRFESKYVTVVLYKPLKR